MREKKRRRPRRSLVLFVIGLSSTTVALLTVVGPPLFIVLAMMTGQLFAFDDVIFRRRLGANCVLNTENSVEIDVSLQTNEGRVLVPSVFQGPRSYKSSWDVPATGRLAEMVVSGNLVAGRETHDWPPYESHFLIYANQGTINPGLTKSQLAAAWQASTNVPMPALQSVNDYRPAGEDVIAILVVTDIALFLLATPVGVFCLILGRHYRKMGL